MKMNLSSKEEPEYRHTIGGFMASNDVSYTLIRSGEAQYYPELIKLVVAENTTINVRKYNNYYVYKVSRGYS